MTILNIFITFGDTFLPDPNSYDELYYELVRVRDTVHALELLGPRTSVSLSFLEFP